MAISILKMEENKEHYFKKGKNATETHKKTGAVYEEGAVTVSKVVCEVLCWMMLRGGVDQLRLTN